MTWFSTVAAAEAAADPAGGAALDQVAIATGGATVAIAGLLWLIARSRRSGRPVAP